MENKITTIKKRDGGIVDFDQDKITKAVYKALTSSGQGDGEKSKRVSNRVLQLLNRRFKKDEIPHVEQIQDIVEEVLILENLVETAKAYILYREQRRRIREAITVSEEAVDRVDQYLGKLDWEVQENANMAFSLQGLNQYSVSYIVKKYWLNKIYPKEIREAHQSGDLHLHDLGTLGPYCAGWDLYDLLLKGFLGVPGKVETKPAKHFRAILGQIVNFLFTIQGEVAGAVAFSNFDTLLAPFIRYDNLNYQQVKQALQEFLFNMSVPTRVGFQNPFSNITLDLKPSPVFEKQPVIIGGKPQKETYGEFNEEMKIFNRALYEVYMEGDKSNRPFSFPIPTINITKDFPWDEPAFDGIFQASAKYGINYFANYINSEMKPEDVKSMCCRLRLDLRELYNRGGGGLFGSGSLTGSLGVVTINLPRTGYLSKTKKEFFERLTKLMDLAKESLEMKRKAVENFAEKGLYPYSKYYLSGIKKARQDYYSNHFSTIGLVGMNEALLNFIGEDIGSRRGRKFGLEIMDFMRERLVKYQKDTGNIYNLEQTPAESSLAPKEKVLISQSDPKLTEIGPLIDDYLEKNKEKVQIIGKSQVLPFPKGELFTYGFSRKDQKIKKYPVSALIKHSGDSMYEIETISGRKVKVTKYHSVFTLNKGGIPSETSVEVLKRGDAVAIPRKIEMENIYSEFNLIKEFKKFSLIREKLYLKTTSGFVEQLIANKKVEDWTKQYYRFAFKDVKYWWRKKKIIPLKLIYDLDISLEKEILENSEIFYRKSKNTSLISPLIPLNKDLGFILGIILAEGWIGKNYIEISNTNKELIKEISSGIEKIFGPKSYRVSLQRDKRGYKPLFVITLLKLPTLFINKILKIKGKSSSKSIPSFVYFASDNFVAGLLRGFLVGDGNKYFKKENSDYNFRFYTSSKELEEGLNLLLLKLGILAKIRVDRKDKYNPNWKRNYILSISGASNLQKFCSLVLGEKFKGKVKNSGREIIPNVAGFLKDLVKKYGLKKKDLQKIGIWQSTFDGCVRKNRISKHQLKEILEKLEKKIKNPLLKNLKVLVKGDLYWDPIKSIRKIKTPKYVYDFEVNIKGDLVENFLGGDGLVALHNTSYRLAQKDKEKYSDITTAGTKKVPYYTNSSQLPVNFTDDVFEALKLQDEITCKYTGGSVFHILLGEKVSDVLTVKSLIKKVFGKFHLPYVTITPTFSICPVHGYLSGEHFECPKCLVKQPCEVYSRVIGYIRPVNQWNAGKLSEYRQRKTFKLKEKDI